MATVFFRGSRFLSYTLFLENMVSDAVTPPLITWLPNALLGE